MPMTMSDEFDRVLNILERLDKQIDERFEKFSDKLDNVHTDLKVLSTDAANHMHIDEARYIELKTTVVELQKKQQQLSTLLIVVATGAGVAISPEVVKLIVHVLM